MDDVEEIAWAPEDAAYIRSRSSRYPGALDIDPAWTAEVMTDADLATADPDPKSRVGASRSSATRRPPAAC